MTLAQIRARDSAGVEELAATLGTGEALLTKINAALRDQGLSEASGVSAPVKSGSTSSTGAQAESKAEEAGGLPVAAIISGGAAALVVGLAG